MPILETMEFSAVETSVAGGCLAMVQTKSTVAPATRIIMVIFFNILLILSSRFGGRSNYFVCG